MTGELIILDAGSGPDRERIAVGQVAGRVWTDLLVVVNYKKVTFFGNEVPIFMQFKETNKTH